MTMRLFDKFHIYVEQISWRNSKCDDINDDIVAKAAAEMKRILQNDSISIPLRLNTRNRSTQVSQS